MKSGPSGTSSQTTCSALSTAPSLPRLVSLPPLHLNGDCGPGFQGTFSSNHPEGCFNSHEGYNFQCIVNSRFQTKTVRSLFPLPQVMFMPQALWRWFFFFLPPLSIRCPSFAVLLLEGRLLLFTHPRTSPKHQLHFLLGPVTTGAVD